MAGFDPITFAMLQNMKKSGGIGYSEPTIFRLDKSTETLEPNTFIKVSDKTPDLDTIVSVKGFIEGADTEVSATECIVMHDSEGLSCLVIDAGGSLAPVLYVAKADSIDSAFPERGIYFAYYTPDSYIYYAEFAETIHPIDPKFLPGVCLPVVNITSGTPGNVMFNLSAEESAALDAACETVLPCVVRFDVIEESERTCISSVYQFISAGGVQAYVAIGSGGSASTLMRTESGWVSTATEG